MSAKWPRSAVYAVNSTSAPRPAEPMAYPLVTAFVVLPTASRASVVLRTSSGKSAISAMPPALSVTGPNASRATTRPASASMVVTAMAMPNRSAREKLTRMPAMMTIAGSAVDSSDTAKPWMTLVPCPVNDADAIEFTGR